MIESLQNGRIKQVRRLIADKRFRQRQALFVAEGTRWLEEFEANRELLTAVYATESWLAEQHALVERVGHPAQLVSEQVMASMSDTETASGVLMVARFPERPLPTHPTLLLLLDQIRDPGNMGTMIRTAAAAGVEGLLLTPGSVDPFNPKVVRASMGALLRLPIAQMDWKRLTTYTAETRRWGSSPTASLAYTAVDWTQPATLVISSEAHGLTPQTEALVSDKVVIPMSDQVESLNAAAAAAVLLFEARRQRSG